MHKVAGLKPPSPVLRVTEMLRAAGEMRSLLVTNPLLRALPRGAGQPVLVIPGFGTTDGSTYVLRRYLRKWGYRPETWAQGLNRGFRQRLLQGVEDRLRHIHERSGQAVSIVGQSLGGIYARELARRNPALVRQVITLGSPFGGPDGAAPLVGKIYDRLNPDAQVRSEFEDMERLRELIEQAPPVPASAIYSRGDGVVSWRACVQLNGCRHSENIEVHGSHCGMGVNPAVLYVIADRLAWDSGEWRPFNRAGWRALVYPEAVRAQSNLCRAEL
ncbi:alpha/beta hydrolase [Exilibacterium tricleocarpae]|uniref:Alpha/beta hydrolase n=1 Tax=Exilibacterium tricleocarpae TaxID=2591008 RepID=A0A545SPV2_9GAMM|nr:alpha/beta hydrolase [Exilibacterium tricleocarpae]TQV66991.1 alpha/beta hydrolase [Exilibacterium tricleocarpae]